MTFGRDWTERDALRHPANQHAQMTVIVSRPKACKSPFPASPEVMKQLDGLFVYETTILSLARSDTN